MSLRFERILGGGAEARLGRLHTLRGEVATPAFMPVATRGMMRGVPHDRLRTMGVEMMLSNAFHLYVRPGVETVSKLGGVHGMLAWDGPVLTDSGGFQVFSLNELCQIHEGGVRVENPVHGGWIDWTPRLAFEVQAGLGPDVAMVLDHCPSKPLVRDDVAPAVERTVRWAREQREFHDARGGADSGQAQFGIVQGGVFPDLRESCATALVGLDFDGYAVGGVSVGEGHGAMMRAVEASIAHLPAGKVRYLMGVGAPLDLVEAVARGIDLFDCVYPTRCGRFGTALTWAGRMHLLNARFRDDPQPIDPACNCDACQSGVPRGALRAGLKAKELNPPILLAMHNLHFTQELMRRTREAIAGGSFDTLRTQIRQAYRPKAGSDID